MDNSGVPLRYARITWEDGELELDSEYELKTLGRCAVTDIREKEGWSRELLKSDGAVWAHWREFTDEQRIRALLSIFHMLVVRDNVHPRVVHEAFWEIPEYRNSAIAEDITF